MGRMSGLQVQLFAYKISVRTDYWLERVCFRSQTVRGNTSGWLARSNNQRRALTGASDYSIGRVTQSSRGVECPFTSPCFVYNYWQRITTQIGVHDVRNCVAPTNAILMACRKSWNGLGWVTFGTWIVVTVPDTTGVSTTRRNPIVDIKLIKLQIQENTKVSTPTHFSQGTAPRPSASQKRGTRQYREFDSTLGYPGEGPTTGGYQRQHNTQHG